MLEENSNDSFSCDTASPYTYQERVSYGLLGALLSLYTATVNLFLLIAFLRDRHVQRVPGHIFIVGLMVSSDVIIALVPLPGYLLQTLCGGWPLASWTCDIWITIDYMSTNVSMVSVTTVAFDRFLATNFVFSHKRWMHRTNQIRLCSVLWLFTAVRVVAVFPLWANISDFRRREPPGRCGHPLYGNFTMGIIQRTIALYIPIILLVFFYGAVVFRIIQSSPHFHHTPHQERQRGGAPRVTFHHQQQQPSHSSLGSRISKSFRIVTCVIVSFLLANLPWHIIENMIASKATLLKKTDSVYILAWIMCYMNAFINPLIYPFMHVEYKRVIIRWARCQGGGTIRLQNMIAKGDILSSVLLPHARMRAAAATTELVVDAGEASTSYASTMTPTLRPKQGGQTERRREFQLLQYVTTA